MVRNRKPTGRAAGMPAGIGIGIAAAAGLTVAGAAVIAAMLNGGMIAKDAVGYGAMIILLASSMIGSGIAAALIKHRRLAVSLLCGAGFFGLLLLTSAVFFGGQYQGILPTALLVFGGSAAAALLGDLPAGNRISRRHKIRTG